MSQAKDSSRRASDSGLQIGLRDCGLTLYQDTLLAMRRFTKERTASTADEIWLTTHQPVYTLGQAGRPEHLRQASGIPVVRSDRGGQITYHGPGQAVVYVLYDLRRAGAGIRRMVDALEQTMIDVLDSHGVAASRRARMPGVYVDAAKIGALGMRVSKGCTYHGLSLNVDCDLAPFSAMDTCGFADLADTSMRSLGIAASCGRILGELAADLRQRLSHW